MPHCLQYFLLRRYRHFQPNLRVLLHVSKRTTHHIHALASHLHTNLHQFWSSILSRIGGRSVISSLAPLSLQEVNAFSATICDAINNKYWDCITYVLSSIILWFNDPDILVLKTVGRRTLCRIQGCCLGSERPPLPPWRRQLRRGPIDLCVFAYQLCTANRYTRLGVIRVFIKEGRIWT